LPFHGKAAGRETKSHFAELKALFLFFSSIARVFSLEKGRVAETLNCAVIHCGSAVPAASNSARGCADKLPSPARCGTVQSGRVNARPAASNSARGPGV
jgi:hypothetical protein